MGGLSASFPPLQPMLRQSTLGEKEFTLSLDFRVLTAHGWQAALLLGLGRTRGRAEQSNHSGE